MPWQSLVNAAPDDMNKGGRLASFLNEFPDGKFAAEAKGMRAAMAERAKQASEQLARLGAERDAWADASWVDNLDAYETFLRAWPDGKNAAAAKARVKAPRDLGFFVVLIPIAALLLTLLFRFLG